MELPLCHQTVTVYHREGEKISRRVITGCYYDWKKIQKAEGEGIHRDTAFLLILPSGEQLEPGDRIYDGIGPEIDMDGWAAFIPPAIPGLSEVAYVLPCYFEGKLCHVEAGRK